jgi:hypothetical protein
MRATPERGEDSVAPVTLRVDSVLDLYDLVHASTLAGKLSAAPGNEGISGWPIRRVDGNMFLYDYFDRIAIINLPDRKDRHDSLDVVTLVANSVLSVQKGCVSILRQRKWYDDIIRARRVIAVARSVRDYYWKIRAKTGIIAEPSVPERRSL